MEATRRDFLRTLGAFGLLGAGFDPPTRASELPGIENSLGVLVDLPNCIGCRKCEFACQEAAGFKVAPIETFEDKSVFAALRRPEPKVFTIVNEYPPATEAPQPAYVKVNCMHCNDPACVSACLVGAFRKDPTGAVVYDTWKCMGCRYCMVACPFQIPTYEYDNPLTPQVRKCNFCANKIDKGEVPACVKICPNDALIFGKRSELITLAHERIRSQPDKYVNHVYGEAEVGGTAWLYLSSVPFDKLGFLNLAATAPSKLTETIQHGVFKHFIPPILLYALLGMIYKITRDRQVELPAMATPSSDGRGNHQPPAERAECSESSPRRTERRVPAGVFAEEGGGL